MGEQTLFLRLTPRPLLFSSPPRCISTGKECNVLWSLLFPLLFIALSLPLEAQIMGLCRKGNTPKGLPFILPPSPLKPSLPLMWSLHPSPLLLLCFCLLFFIFPYSCSTLPQKFFSTIDPYPYPSHFSSTGVPSLSPDFLMVLTFGLVKVIVHKASAFASH